MNLNDLTNAIIGFVVIAIISAVGMGLLTGVRATQTVSGVGYNTTGIVMGGIYTITSYLPILALAIVGAVVIGVVYQMFGKQGGQV